MEMKEYLSKPEINFFLSIAIPLIALAVGWGVMTTRLEHVEDTASVLRVDFNKQQSTNEEIKVRLAEIQKDILYIREALDSRN